MAWAVTQYLSSAAAKSAKNKVERRDLIESLCGPEVTHASPLFRAVPPRALVSRTDPRTRLLVSLTIRLPRAQGLEFFLKLSYDARPPSPAVYAVLMSAAMGKLPALAALDDPQVWPEPLATALFTCRAPMRLESHSLCVCVDAISCIFLSLASALSTRQLRSRE